MHTHTRTHAPLLTLCSLLGKWHLHALAAQLETSVPVDTSLSLSLAVFTPHPILVPSEALLRSLLPGLKHICCYLVDSSEASLAPTASLLTFLVCLGRLDVVSQLHFGLHNHISNNVHSPLPCSR